MACGGGSPDERNAELLQTIPGYTNAVEIDRHSEDVTVSGAVQRVLKVQYATADQKPAVQAFYGERLLRAGFKHDTEPDPNAPRDAVRFRTGDGLGAVVITFAAQQTAWPAGLGVTPVATPPPGAGTFFVVSVRAGNE
jgi:hypothetical protein